MSVLSSEMMSAGTWLPTDFTSGPVGCSECGLAPVKITPKVGARNQRIDPQSVLLEAEPRVAWRTYPDEAIRHRCRNRVGCEHRKAHVNQT